MTILGVLLGAFGGAMLFDDRGLVVGAIVGGLVGWQLRRRRGDGTTSAPPPRPVYGPRAAPDASTAAILARLDAIERRLAALEGKGTVADVSPALGDALRGAGSPREAVASTPVVDEAAPAVPAGPVPSAPVSPVPPAPVAPAHAPVSSLLRATHPLWAWLTGGNALTRVGVVVLFFGVAFMLRWFAERFTVPIELRLAGVAAGGLALGALGEWLARRRPGYGLSLQGAGAGILYLTVFAAFRLYAVLTPAMAFPLLIAIAAATVALAWRADSQPLAGLAIAGGFLAPFLAGGEPGHPALLLGYFAVLNGAIFALAWHRAWRALNALGFVFTFALGAFWGWNFYAPEHFRTVEPFLVLFFAFYVAIAVLYARRGALTVRAPVDGLLVFGVPLVGFGLQAGLVRDTRYGVAISALVVAAIYAVLWRVLARSALDAQRLLARSFLVLAVLFATIAIAFAADPEWTAAWWALEAAGVYWLGARQRQASARAFALLLQLAAAFAFLLGTFEAEAATPFLNVAFFGCAMIAIAALATVLVGDRDPDLRLPWERKLVPLVFAWGVAWWVGAGGGEVVRHASRALEPNLTLAWIAGSVALALALARPLRWPRLSLTSLVLLPAIAVTGWEDVHLQHTTLVALGYAIWPFAWAIQAVALRTVERAGYAASTFGGRRWLHDLHAASAVVFVVWGGWEAGEWVGRIAPADTVWTACATALPAIVHLFIVSRSERMTRWPLEAWRDAYAQSAGVVVAALLAAWFVAINLLSPGDPDPLPYLPLAHPLDVTLALAALALLAWGRRCSGLPERTLYVALGAGLFLAMNGVVARTAHHWANVPWSVDALLASKPTQAAITLTWTATALPLMAFATRRGIRPLWMVGGALLALVVAKLFLLDLAALSGLTQVVAFVGVGALLLVIGYVAPLPPAASAGEGPR